MKNREEIEAINEAGLRALRSAALETEIAFLRESYSMLRNQIIFEERVRASEIVKDFEVYTPYIVQKRGIEERKQKLIDRIMGGVKRKGESNE